jgi:hypothetical protein
LFGGVPIDPIFDLAKHHLHENRLGTGPSTKHPAKDHREEDHEYDECEHSKCEKKEVLWAKDLAEENEFSFQHIDHENGLAVQLDEGQCKEKYKVEDAEQRAFVVQRALGLLWMDVFPVSFLVYGSYRVSETLVQVYVLFAFHHTVFVV